MTDLVLQERLQSVAQRLGISASGRQVVIELRERDGWQPQCGHFPADSLFAARAPAVVGAAL